jgi:hypothetical protein
VINSRRMSWEEDVECVGETRNANKTLVEKPEKNKPLEKYRRS